jgi:hypothetical protein
MTKQGFGVMVAAVIMLTAAAHAQSPKPGAKKPPPLDSEALYLTALGEDQRLDGQRIAAARAWVDELDAILIVDQEIMGSARGTAAAFYPTNKAKHKNLRMFAEHEITPYLFKNSDEFRDVFAMAIADTMTVDEIKHLSGSPIGPKDPLAPKVQEAGQKFDRAASFLASALTAQMIETTNFSAYGLDLTLPTAPKP